VLTVDLDGVICRPPFGVNLGISSDALDPAAAPARAFVLPCWLGGTFDHLRFDFRRPLPEAREALSALAELREVVVLTGRRTSPQQWLRRHGLAEPVSRVVINDSAEASAHFKLRCVQELGAVEHIDDDGRTARLLAERGPARVYLRDWPRNRGMSYPSNVTRVADLLELVRLLSTGAEEGARDAPD
jgi:hypothetical protein